MDVIESLINGQDHGSLWNNQSNILNGTNITVSTVAPYLASSAISLTDGHLLPNELSLYLNDSSPYSPTSNASSSTTASSPSSYSSSLATSTQALSSSPSQPSLLLLSSTYSELINLNESLSYSSTNSNTSLGWSDSSTYPVYNGTSNFDNIVSFWESIPYPKSGYTQAAIILLAFVITIIMIIIVVGNLLVCIAITTEKSLKTVQNWFIASLAVSDLLLGLVIMPFSLAHQLMGYWIFGKIWCDVHHALDVLLCTASINNLCLISLDRYWSVTQAVEYLKKRTPSRAIFMICFVWIFSGLVSLPPLVGWKNESAGPGECKLSDDIGYVVYSAFGSFYVPAVVMVFVYAKIFVAARSRARKHVKKRKLHVAPEVTNDPTKDKSTTTTTCTSLSNPSPPDGNRDDNDVGSESGLDASDYERIPTIAKYDGDMREGGVTGGGCLSPLTPCSTPTTGTAPKVTFSPKDTVYGEDGIERESCSSPSALVPSTPQAAPPQIIIETPNNSPINKKNNNNNINSHQHHIRREDSSEQCESDFKHSNALCETIQAKSSAPVTCGRLSERKCPKLRIAIIDSTHGNFESDCGAGSGCGRTTAASHGNSTNIPSILRQNGLSASSQAAIISETRLISGDDDSDAIESPVSKTSGSLALETKSFLTAPRLSRSPFGSTMSIADYDDSDLCNDSNDLESKPKKKHKGKVQYQTPPVVRRHTQSDAERHKRKIAKARERRATLILGLIMGSFILAWLPFFVMYLTAAICNECDITTGLTIGYWLGYCNSAINPIIYTVFNRDFRKAFRKILFR